MIAALDPAPGWGLVVDDRDQSLTRVHESLLTLADGRLGTDADPRDGGFVAAETP